MKMRVTLFTSIKSRFMKKLFITTLLLLAVVSISGINKVQAQNLQLFYDAVDILYFQRNSNRNDHLCAYECDLRKIQEVVSCNICTCSSVYLEIYFNLIDLTG